MAAFATLDVSKGYCVDEKEANETMVELDISRKYEASSDSRLIVENHHKKTKTMILKNTAPLTGK